MRKHLFFLPVLCFSLQVLAQVPLPVTLNFTSNSTAAWSDGIAQDGDGGSSKISGLDIEIFAANGTDFNKLAGSIIIWKNNNYYASGDNTFNGITVGPDNTVTNNGVPAMVIRSSDNTKNFSLKSISAYDWGGVFWTIRTYDNGALIGSINVDFDQVSFNPKTLNQAGELTPGLFQNIDEIRILPRGYTVIWPAINKIELDNPAGVLPVNFYNFSGRKTNDNIVLQWNTGNEAANSSFIIERSYNGSDFDSISVIRGHDGSANSRPLQYIDNLPNLSVNKIYYRLKQLDADGKYYYSDVIAIALPASKATITLYPNPASSYVIVNFPKDEESLGMRILNGNGQSVWTKKYDRAGKQTRVAINSLPTGLYRLLIEYKNGEVISLPFSKQ